MVAHLSAVIDTPVIRPSASVNAVAAMLGDVPSQIRRMLARGDLEGHRQGKRGVRVYLDSVEAWQRDNPITPVKSAKKAAPPAPKPLSGATRAAHRHAVAHLQGLGLVPASRP